MALTVKRPHGRPVVEESKTPLQKSLECVFRVSNQTSARKDNWVDLESLGFKRDFIVNLSEPVSFEISTSWKASGGAAIANKLNEIFNSNLVKMIGGDKAQSSTPTDAWTQKITEIGNPIPLHLKFRVYHTSAGEMNTISHQVFKDETGERLNQEIVSYKDYIRFFMLICAPAEQYGIGTATIKPLISAAKTATENAKKAREAYDSVSKNGENIVSAGLAALHELGKDIFNAAGVNTVAEGPRMNYTLMIKRIGSFNFPPAIDWIVKTFSWTPSMQFTLNNDNKMPEPLWVDFEVELETNFAPSNAFVPKIFLKDLPSDTPSA